MIKLECKDCKGIILFNEIGSGSASKESSTSYCRCIDRDTNDKKKIDNVKYMLIADFKPDYMSIKK